MLIKKPTDIKPSEITPKSVYMNRRRFMSTAAGALGMGALGVTALGLAGKAAGGWFSGTPAAEHHGRPLDYKHPGPFGTDEKQTPYKDVTHYNNYYEFGTDKYSPAERAQSLTTSPWSVSIEGEVEHPGVQHMEDVLKRYALEERIYRLRCVEGWSMVIPWVGFPLGEVLRRAGPTSRAKYVKFTTVYRPSEMPGQQRSVLDWPYVEGLRMDEAMHPLTILAVGLYGEVLPNQNGAPIRLVVPWKYGFKSIKSIVKIELVEEQPVSTWTRAAPNEYGFYSNVNPHVDHPRWSQKRERRIGEFLKRDTLMFNGYGDQVAELYKGMDLRKFF